MEISLKEIKEESTKEIENETMYEIEYRNFNKDTKKL